MNNPIPKIPRAGAAPLILRAFAILLIGAGAGLAHNAASRAGIPLRTPAQASFEDLVNWSLHVEGLRVTLADAKRAFDRREAVFIDARPPHEYAAGHIPGALNLPVADLEARAGEVLKGLGRDARIITYCSGERCQSSILLARRLTEGLGYARTQVFFDGWHAWNAAAYPFVIGERP